MISSPEEGRLLLNKWMSEAARVLALASSASLGFVSRIEGVILETDGDATFCLSSGDDFMVFNLNCVIGYGENEELPSTLRDALSKEGERCGSFLVLRYQNGERLVLCVKD